MEIADALYGVSMRGDGVTHGDQPAAARAPRPAEARARRTGPSELVGRRSRPVSGLWENERRQVPTGACDAPSSIGTCCGRHTLVLLIVGVPSSLLALVGGVALVRARRGAAAPAPAGARSTIPTQGDDDRRRRCRSRRRAPRLPSRRRHCPASRCRRPPRVGWLRLRARLARSRAPSGKALLALLSRDALDEADWDDVEDPAAAGRPRRRADHRARRPAAHCVARRGQQ